LDVLIKRPTAVAKIRKLAKRTSETLTDAVERAVDDRLAKLEPVGRKKGRIDRKKLAEVLNYSIRFRSTIRDHTRRSSATTNTECRSDRRRYVRFVRDCADEAERAAFVDVLDSEKAIISTVTYVESVMVFTGRSKRLASAMASERSWNR
jgi:hypothetical protein